MRFSSTTAQNCCSHDHSFARVVGRNLHHARAAAKVNELKYNVKTGNFQKSEVSLMYVGSTAVEISTDSTRFELNIVYYHQ